MRKLFYLLLACGVLACAGDAADDWPTLDLTRHNIPLTIQAPDSAKVNSQSFGGLMHDVTVESPEDDYGIQILAADAITNDMTRLKADQIDGVRDNRYFSRIVREEPDGFVFENRIDSTTIYGFRYIVYQGDKEYVFQNSLSGTFTEAAVEKMYSAVKQKPRQ